MFCLCKYNALVSVLLIPLCTRTTKVMSLLQQSPLKPGFFSPSCRDSCWESVHQDGGCHISWDLSRIWTAVGFRNLGWTSFMLGKYLTCWMVWIMCPTYTWSVVDLDLVENPLLLVQAVLLVIALVEASSIPNMVVEFRLGVPNESTKISMIKSLWRGCEIGPKKWNSKLMLKIIADIPAWTLIVE